MILEASTWMDQLRPLWEMAEWILHGINACRSGVHKTL